MAEQLIELVYDTKKTDRLVKGGIRYTDQLFNKIEKQLMELYKQCGSYEEFLEKAHGFVADNPLTLQGYDAYMTDLVKKAISDVRFSRPAQKVLTETVISNSVGELVKSNGEDLRDHIRETTKRAYKDGTPPQKYYKDLQAPPLVKGKDGAKRNLSSRARCKMIARTETKRALNTSNYIIGKERGATHWYALGFTDEHTCKNCISVYGTPSDPKYYSIDDVEYLPPLHPNCRHTAVYVKRDTGDTGEPETPDTGEELPIPTPAQLKKNLRPDERNKYNSYQRNIILQREWLKENPNAGADEIAKHRKRLEFLEGKFNELHRKALGLNGGTGKPTPKPKPNPEPKPEPKPKTPKEPKTKPKPTSEEPTKIQTPTREQLEKNLTKKEREEYKVARDQIQWAKDILKDPNRPQKQKDYAQKSLDETIPRFKKLNDKALGLTSKTSTKKTTTKRKTKSKEKPLVALDKPKGARLTKEECDSLTFDQLAEHHDAKYKGLVKNEVDGKEYHVFEQTFDNGEIFKLHVEKGAVKAYEKGGVATANEIIHEVFKVPEVLRKETNEIYFKNTQQGVVKKSNGKFDVFRETKTAVVNGYNTVRKRQYKGQRIDGQLINDPDHKIVINPKLFKKLKDFTDIIKWRNRGDQITNWKHTIHHEFIHSIDDSRSIWKNDERVLSKRKEYLEIQKEERFFTNYSNGDIEESFAEHGGYISYMLANPEEQSKKIPIRYLDDERKLVDEEIDFNEYKQRYPKHYKYFIELLGGED